MTFLIDVYLYVFVMTGWRPDLVRLGIAGLVPCCGVFQVKH